MLHIICDLIKKKSLAEVGLAATMQHFCVKNTITVCVQRGVYVLFIPTV